MQPQELSTGRIPVSPTGWSPSLGALPWLQEASWKVLVALLMLKSFPRRSKSLPGTLWCLLGAPQERPRAFQDGPRVLQDAILGVF